ncbi:MAG: hypothetical protein QOF66_3175 [Mycobacterium sp.]|jgi:hypothetical protein|uniref:hypothetical protein n=1 Tax=Mycobacterium sp. TaxID=1785 RepID=UPI0028B39BB5|nr:hypothetical protein [Mycobacterium sp.]
MSPSDRAVDALKAVFPPSALRARRTEGPHGDMIVSVDDFTDLVVRWLSVGWPRQVAEALHDQPRPDVLVAPAMSPGARKAAHDAGVGWVDESGAADIYLRSPAGTTIVIQTKGTPPQPLDSRIGWRRTTLAVCEALLAGKADPNTSSVIEATGLSMGSVTAALKFLERDGHLTSEAARGPNSARQIVDRDVLLDAYAIAAQRLRPPTSIHVGVLWRDPVTEVIEIGRRWCAAGIDWATTSALSAAVMAPMQTEIAPMEIYVSGRTPSDLQRVALAADLPQIQGGRLVLRPFPTPAVLALTEKPTAGFQSMLWPRVYADLRTTGVRGEDVAEHLREEMTT